MVGLHSLPFFIVFFVFFFVFWFLFFFVSLFLSLWIPRKSHSKNGRTSEKMPLRRTTCVPFFFFGFWVLLPVDTEEITHQERKKKSEDAAARNNRSLEITGLAIKKMNVSIKLTSCIVLTYMYTYLSGA